MASLEQTVQQLSAQYIKVQASNQASRATVVTQQEDIRKLKTQYNEIWLAYAVQDGSSVIAPHSDRKPDVERMLKTNVGLSYKFS